MEYSYIIYNKCVLRVDKQTIERYVTVDIPLLSIEKIYGYEDLEQLKNNLKNIVM